MRSVLLAIVAFVTSGALIQQDHAFGGNNQCLPVQRVVGHVGHIAPIVHHKQAVIQKQVVAHHVQPELQILNNVIGVPVPVPYVQPQALQGSTVYGYSALTESQGNVDLALLYDEASRLAQQAQNLSGQASSQFNTLIEKQADSQALVAQIKAQGEAAAAALRAVHVQELEQKLSVKISGESQSTTTNAADSGNGVNFELLKDSGDAKSLLVNKCGQCHGANSDRPWKTTDPITQEIADDIHDRILSDDEDYRMPAGGSKLSPHELKILIKGI